MLGNLFKKNFFINRVKKNTNINNPNKPISLSNLIENYVDAYYKNIDLYPLNYLPLKDIHI